MLMTGAEYRDSIRDGRQVWMNGERIDDVPSHPAFKPIVDVRARIYDMAHEEGYVDVMSYRDDSNEAFSTAYKPPRARADWRAKRAWVDTVMHEEED